MARRVFLHVGTPKTGTTYLQSLLWANQEPLPSTGSCYRSAMLATQVPADVDVRAVAEVAVESIASLLCETDNLATWRLIDDQRRLAAELEQRTLRLEELGDQVRRDRAHRSVPSPGIPPATSSDASAR